MIKTNNAIMLRFLTRSRKKFTQEVHFTRAKALDSRTTQLARDSSSKTFGTCGKPGYDESDSSKMAFGRVRLAESDSTV